tara:strand:- start:809 stop:2335 length:1527 start_codon:yes stop_codon:yes gene_type:complete
VVQVSENRLEWIVCDLAIQLARAVHVPLHATLSGRQIVEQLIDSGAKKAFLSDRSQLTKLTAHIAELPTDLECWVFDSVDDCPGGVSVASLAQLESRGDLSEAARVLKDAQQQVTSDTLATLIYTSGTTGEPKGVMLTHGNFYSNTHATIAAIDMAREDHRLTFLPLSHVFARTCDLYTWLMIGYQLSLAESRETVLSDCQELKPTTLNGVPYFFDKVRRYLVSQQAEVADGALRDLLGGRMRMCCSGGAALPEHVFDFYWQQQIPLLEGYGLTETSPVITVSTPQHYRRKSAGRAISGVEIQIENEEILTRGPHVMCGYYQKSAATQEVMSDGWFCTGDLGYLDDDGFLFITGRRKELLVLASGKNVAPVYLESLLLEEPLIAQVLVVGDHRSFLSALVVPDCELLKKKIHEQGQMSAGDLEQTWPSMLTDPSVIELFSSLIACQLSDVSHHEQVRRFSLLPDPFSIDRGEVTAKLSLRREVIGEHYSAQIEAMYGTDWCGPVVTVE